MAAEGPSNSRAASWAFPTPSPPGPPRRQTATAAADKPGGVDRGRLRPRGKGRVRTLPRGGSGSSLVRPPRLPLGIPQAGSRAHGCKKGTAAALGNSRLASPFHQGLSDNGNSGSNRPGKALPCLSAWLLTSFPFSLEEPHIACPESGAGLTHDPWGWTACLPPSLGLSSNTGKSHGQGNPSRPGEELGPYPQGQLA